MNTGSSDDDATRIDNDNVGLETASDGDAAALSRIGPYRLIELLGEGGMGSVWLAEQKEPVERKVALKLIRSKRRDGLDAAYFEVERQMLARMSHPCIAQVYDAGTTDDGRPWFAMEWVRGEPITDYCAANELNADARIELMVRVCMGVQHAHQRGVIHRDLKPANVLVTHVDETHLPRIIDFGVATRVEEHAGEPGSASSDLAGTRAYMSPEQASGDGARLDTRSDVYSLGVMLFELLTGRRPPESAKRDSLETFRSALGGRRSQPGKFQVSKTEAGDDSLLSLAEHLDPELRWILNRTLAPDREQRYQSATDLARELQRHLDGERVEAVPPTRRYRWRKFIARHRVGLSAGGLVGLALIAGLALAIWGLVQAQSERDRARVAAERAEQTTEFVTRMLGSIDPDYARGADTTLMRRVLSDAAERALIELADQPGILAEIELTVGDTYIALGEEQLAGPHLERAAALSAQDPALQRINLRARGQLVLRQLLLGEYAEGLEALDRLLTDAKPLLPLDDPIWLDLLSTQASLLKEFERYDEAERVIQRVIGTTEDHSDPELVSLRLDALRTLAQLHSDQMQSDEAHRIYERLRAEAEQVDDPSALRHLLSALNDHAVVYLREQRYADAEPLLREVIERQSALYGPDHIMNVSPISNLGGSLRQQGRPEEALPFYRQARDRLVDHYGLEHPRSLIAQYNLGNGYLDVGDPETAVELHREVLHLAPSVLPDNRYVTGMFHLGAGKSELAIGNIQTSIEHLEVAAREISESAGEDHARAIEAREFLARARGAMANSASQSN